MQNLALKHQIAYRPDIDGLRAIAIISVIIFHFYSALLPSGFIGVDVFFVISGFLITKIILKEYKLQKFSFVKFYIRRIRRIFPALFAMLFFTFLFALLILTSSDMVWFSRGFYYASFQVSNFFFQRNVDYFDQDRDVEPLLHTWSLGVEEQFYLLMPVFMLGLFHLRKNENLPFYALALLSLISLGLSQYLVFTNQKIAFYSLWSRFWELGIGCLMAFDKIQKMPRKANQILSLLGLSMIVISAFTIKYSYFPGLMALLPCIGAALIIFSGEHNKTLVTKFLSNKILVFIGKISYSLYLWHLPLVIFYQEYTNQNSLSVQASLLLLLILVIISYLSWRFIESPFRKTYIFSKEAQFKNFGKKIVALFRQPFFAAALCIIFLATISWISKNNNGLKLRLVSNKLIEKSDLDQYGASSKAKICGIGKKSQPFPNIEDCVIGKNQKNFEVVVFGDSHAGHYSAAVERWAEKRGLSVMSFYLFSCKPLLVDEQDSAYNERCGNYRKKIEQILQERSHIKYVFLASSWFENNILGNEYEESFKKNFTETVQKITALNAKLIVLGRVPDFDLKDGKSNPLKCIEKNLVPMQKIIAQPISTQECSSLDLPLLNRQSRFNSIMKDVVSKYKNTYFFDPFPYFCDNKKCYAVKDGILLYADKGHLNSQGSDYIGKDDFYPLEIK